MAAPTTQIVPVGPDTLISVKVSIGNVHRRLALPLKDLSAHVLPQKLRSLLGVPSGADVIFERFSDSAGSYVALDSNNPAIYKQLYRAAKAKLKLRIKATVTLRPVPTRSCLSVTEEQAASAEPLQLPTPPKASPALRHSYLDTVLSTTLEQDPQSTSPGPSATSAIDAVDSAYEMKTTSLNKSRKAALADPIRPETPVTWVRELAPLTQALGENDSEQGGSDPLLGPCSIDCNSCGKSIPDEHYHCGICENGDFDLCCSCVAANVLCSGSEHWLVMRRMQDGRPVSSSTEIFVPKKRQERQLFEADERNSAAALQSSRTCNSCINDFPDKDLVTCTNCADYDLCTSCFSLGDHGHHPGHRFHPVSAHAFKISSRISLLCEPGRGVSHAAICDGCDQRIFGVRHKCLVCPDWDYCSTCILSASQKHPGHRFAPLFEEIAELNTREEVHHGIYCDGPLCVEKSSKRYIRGVRYKCSICHDTDFCANCEAVPTLGHNRTHPLIKLKTICGHVSVTTLGENSFGQSLPQMGDRPKTTEVVAKAVPTGEIESVPKVKTVDPGFSPDPSSTLPTTEMSELHAIFESDALPDGSSVPANCVFSQSWTLRNRGSCAWPAGCAVYFTGGDHMLNVDTKNPSNVSAMVAATKSTIITKDVEVGQTATFSVLLKSPERAGEQISYWRLKTPQGIAFGHKLWVDINVTDPSHQGEDFIGLNAIDSPAPLISEATAERGAQTASKEDKGEGGPDMVLSKLEKEPAVSTMDGPSSPASPGQEVSQVKKEVEDLIEDIETLDFEDGEETDDGFLTDEEYDILDASDEDLLMQAQNAAAKK